MQVNEMISNIYDYDLIKKKIREYIIKNINNFNLYKSVIEGESKIIYKDINSDLCLIKLKPTLYSYTNNRYGIVEGTDILRLKIWEEFNNNIINIINKYITRDIEISDLRLVESLDLAIKNGIIKTDTYYNNGYFGNIEINNVSYAIAVYVDDSTPLEVVYKCQLNGTMKYNLIDVDKYPTREGKIINYDNYMKEIIRFDWRNPLENNGVRCKDECIPDDFAKFWIDTKLAKILAMLYSRLINYILEQHNYKLIDICYFIDASGKRVYSEISPDCMRIIKGNLDYDKDLWRAGKSDELIKERWKVLLKDLKNKF